MAKFDMRLLAARAAGRPIVPEFTSVTGAAQNTNVAVNDRQGQGIQPEDMLANVFDTSTAPWTDITSKFTVTSAGNIQNTTDSTGSAHTLFIVWYKRRPGLG
jgi:hypothetical protein